jgi:hypothetical protein
VPLNDEQKKQLAELRRMEKEPASPPPSVNFTLPLDSDTAWERAKQLGIVSDPAASNGEEEEEEEDDDSPRRRGGFAERWGGS